MRDLLRVGGVLLVLGALTLIARSWAETGWAAPAPASEAKPKTKVALINISHVLKSYDKFKTFRNDLLAAMVPYQAKIAAFKTEGQKLETEAKNVKTTAARRLQIEKRFKELKKADQDNNAAAEKEVRRMQEEQLSTLYGDVEVACRRYAVSNGIELVMHYNDGTTKDEVNASENIARKMHGALMPLYAAPGIDITKEIIAVLNDNYRRKKGG